MRECAWCVIITTSTQISAKRIFGILWDIVEAFYLYIYIYSWRAAFVSFVLSESILPEFHSYFELLGERQIMRVSPLREKHSPNSCDVHILKALRIPAGGSHISRSSGAVLENLCLRREYCVLQGDTDMILNAGKMHAMYVRCYITAVVDFLRWRAQFAWSVRKCCTNFTVLLLNTRSWSRTELILYFILWMTWGIAGESRVPKYSLKAKTFGERFVWQTWEPS